MTTRCGFIGLGEMGAALAGNLAPKGLPATVYDLDQAATNALVGTGAAAATSVAEVAKSADVVGVCVPADSHVRSVLCGPDGVFAHAAPGTIVAIHSTVLPETVVEMAAEGRAHDIDVLEVPVAGGAARASVGDALFMVAGDRAVMETARPYLEAAASKIIFAGEPGTAAKLKLAINVLSNLAFAASLEAMLLARAMGLSQELLEEAGQAISTLGAMQLQYLSSYKLPQEARLDEGLQSYMRSRMEIAQKDLGHALTMARECGLSMPMTGLATQLLPKIYGVDGDNLRGIERSPRA